MWCVCVCVRAGDAGAGARANVALWHRQVDEAYSLLLYDFRHTPRPIRWVTAVFLMTGICSDGRLYRASQHGTLMSSMALAHCHCSVWTQYDILDEISSSLSHSHTPHPLPDTPLSSLAARVCTSALWQRRIYPSQCSPGHLGLTDAFAIGFTDGGSELRESWREFMDA